MLYPNKLPAKCLLSFAQLDLAIKNALEDIA